MKMIMAALAVSTLLAGASAPASAESYVTIPADEYARLMAEKSKQMKWRRYVQRQMVYDADALPIGTGIWWQQMDREQRGGRR
jgi:hypothetical protein